jgi:hypothetical protein
MNSFGKSAESHLSIIFPLTGAMLLGSAGFASAASIAMPPSVTNVLPSSSRTILCHNGSGLPGAVGVWSQSDSVIYFDQLLVGPPVQAAK